MKLATMKMSQALPKRRVPIVGSQKGNHPASKEIETDWPDKAIHALMKLKGEWFYDSYLRFESSNYVQKQIDIVLELYGIELPNKKILDFGCGFGAASYCLFKRGATEIIAADLKRTNIATARTIAHARNYSQFVTFVAEDVIPTLLPSSFDVVWLQAVLEHLLPKEREIYLQRLWSCLRPNGWLIVTETPNRFWPYEHHTSGGKWWIPWMSAQTIFRKMRTNEEFSKFSDTEFYRSGIVGSTYGEILRCIGHPKDCKEPALEIKGYLRALYSHARVRTLVRKCVVEFLTMLERPAVKLFRRPMTAFMPYLNHVAFQKKQSGSEWL